MRTGRECWCVARGFTLIELMVVVIILGILALVVAPRIPELVSRAKEGATKGALSTLRSAIHIYYTNTEGYYPTGPLNQALVPRFIKRIPMCDLPSCGHPATSTVGQSLVADPPHVVDMGLNAIFGDIGMWAYCNRMNGLINMSGGLDAAWGDLWIGCLHTDRSGEQWIEY